MEEGRNVQKKNTYNQSEKEAEAREGMAVMLRGFSQTTGWEEREEGRNVHKRPRVTQGVAYEDEDD
jgi:hypothetical protein